jgi:hypothetical protein
MHQYALVREFCIVAHNGKECSHFLAVFHPKNIYSTRCIYLFYDLK